MSDIKTPLCSLVMAALLISLAFFDNTIWSIVVAFINCVLLYVLLDYKIKF